MTRILIVDDHGVIRGGLRAMLEREADMEVVGEAWDGPQAIQKARELRPDVVLLDITLPGISGIEVTRELRNALPSTHVLILTLHEEVGMLREALAAGALGYVPKRAIDIELINAIRTVAQGQIYVHPAMADALWKDMAPRAARVEAASLTPREIQVLKLLARGYTNSQIAKELSLSVRTVDTHRANLMGKLGAANRADLVRYATENRLLD